MLEKKIRCDCNYISVKYRWELVNLELQIVQNNKIKETWLKSQVKFLEPQRAHLARFVQDPDPISHVCQCVCLTGSY